MEIPHGVESPSREALRGIAQISRHAHPLGKSGHCGEEEGEDRPEGKFSRGGAARSERGAVEGSDGTDDEGADREDENRHDHVLKLRRPIGSEPGEREQRQEGATGDEPGVEPFDREERRHPFGETDRVEGNRDRLREKQDQPDRTAELRPQGSRDQVVVPAPLHPEIGRDRGE